MVKRKEPCFKEKESIWSKMDDKIIKSNEDNKKKSRS